MSKVLALFLVLILGSPHAAVFAHSTSEPKLKVLPRFQSLIEENAQLRQRVEALEKALADINQKLSAHPAASAAEPAVVAAPAPEKPKAPEKPSLKTKYTVDLYGYMKLDIAMDSSRTDTTGNYARWVLSEAVVADNDRHFSQNINQSRFGLNFTGPQAGNAKVSGKYEIDLYGGGGTDNSAQLRTRHAYFQLDWPDEVSLLMGQTWDLVGPESPNQLNYSVAWWTGNLGFRHPQLRLTKSFTTGDKKLTVAVAASRKIGDAAPFNNPPDTGADSGSPAFQGRIGYTFPTTGKNKGTIGVWGHSGREEYDFNPTGSSKSVKSSSLGADVNLAFTNTIQLKGEVWQGKNLDDYVGGIGQGVVVTTASGTYINAMGVGTNGFIDAKPLKSKGGWVELTFGPFGKWRYNLGASMDDPDNGPLANSTGSRPMRTLNRSRWLNALYELNEAVQIGAEHLRLETEYKNQRRGDDNRFQLSFIYKF